MVQTVGIDNKIHKNLAIDLSLVAAAIASERTVPVVLSEFQKIATQSPIVFTKNAITGRFVAIAMLGFDQGENLYCEANKWTGFYTPLNIMRQPFFVGGDDENGANDEYAICIDVENSAIINDGKNAKEDSRLERIFDESGENTDYFLNIKEMLIHLLQEEQKTQDFVDTLLEFDLIAPLQFDVVFNNQQPQRIDGLYRIDEDKLIALPDADILKLYSEGLMKPIYTMIGSLEQIPILIDTKNTQLV